MAVSKRTRFEVLRRDEHACRYCGQAAPDVKLTVDHVLPVALGGTDDPSNLVAACVDCNAGKSSTSPDEHLVAQVSEDAVRWAAAKAKAAAEMRAEANEYSVELSQFEAAWMSWDKTMACIPRDWMTSIRTWLRDGLSIDQILDALDIALVGPARPRDVFRYMSGVIRNWLREIEDRAQAILRSE